MPDRLVILQRRLTHYRVPFFAALRERLADAGFELRLLVGQPHTSERSKHDAGQLDWAVPTPCHYTLGGRLCWLAQSSWPLSCLLRSLAWPSPTSKRSSKPASARCSRSAAKKGTR